MENEARGAMYTAGSLDSLLPLHSPARGIAAALRAQDFSAFDAVYKNDACGRLAIDPRRLVGVWVLGLLRGIDSSVKLARACSRDIEFRWLLGDVPVEKSTLSAFRRERTDELRDLSGKVLAALGQSGQLPGKSLAVDGTIVRAAASLGQVRKRGQLERKAKRLRDLLDQRLRAPEPDAETIDALEESEAKVEAALRKFDALGLFGDDAKLTMTEPDASMKKLKGNAGYAPAHNVQVVSDADTGAIVHAEIVDASNDVGQLALQIDKARQVLETIGAGPLESAAADSGYHTTEDLIALDASGVTAFVPNARNDNRTPKGVDESFTHDKFTYDAESDTYTCPAGQPLHRRKATGISVVYKARTAACAACPFKHLCCPNTKQGRNISRSKHAELIETVAERVASGQGRTAAAKRRTTAEGIFARLKELLHWPRCRLYGRRGAEAELLWRQLAYNLMHLTGQWKPLVHTPKKALQAA